MGSDSMLGSIAMFGGNFAPRGWALCDGQLLPIPQNTALFSILGTIYGGDGRTTFALPDLRGRVAIHAGQGAGLTPRRLGSRGGLETTTLTKANLPAHNHDVTIKVADQDGSHHAAFKGVLGKKATDDAGTTAVEVYVLDTVATFGNGNTLGGVVQSNVGSNQAVNNMQPYLAVNYCIALTGMFPSRS
jgi:microcystin-dependent protein